MAGEDGQVRIKVNLDSSEIDKDMHKLQMTLSKQTESLNRQGIIVEKLTSRYEALYQKAREKAAPTIESGRLLKDIKIVEQAMSRVKESYQNAKLSPNSQNIQKILSEYDKLSNKLSDLKKQHQELTFSPEMQNRLKALEKEIDLAVEKEKRLTDEVIRTKNAIEELQNNKVSGFQDKFSDISKSFDTMKNNIKSSQSMIQNAGRTFGSIFENIGSKISGLGSKILSLAGSAFVFNIISAGFREMSRGVQNIIAKDDKLISSLSQVRANLWTAFYPIYQVVLPAIRALGQALSWITGQLAGFIAMLTGTSVKANQVGAQAMALQAQTSGSNACKSLEKQANSYKKIGKEAKKAQGELASFDKIEVLRQEHVNEGMKDVSPQAGGGSGASGEMPGAVPGFDQSLKNFDPSILDNITDKFKDLANVFKKGFDIGFVDKNFDDILDGLGRISEAAKEVFNDPGVTEGFNKALNSIVETLGKVTGSIASIGVTIGRLLVGGIAGFLGENKDKIKDSLIKCFDTTKEISDFIGNLSVAFANVFEVFGGKEAQNVLSNALSSLYAIFDGFFLNLYRMAVKEVTKIFGPFETHQKDIKKAFEDILEAASDASEGIKKVFQKLSDKLNDIYENSISPTLDELGEIWDETFGMIIESWNKYIGPVLKRMAAKWDDTVNKHINPAIESFGKFVNKYFVSVIPVLKKLWDFLKPFVKWIIENVFDKISTTIETLWDTAMNILSGIAGFLSGLFKTFEGLVDLVVGLFAGGGDWERAWNGAGKVVEGMLDMVKGHINTLSSLINGVINLMVEGINCAIRGLNRISFDMPEWLGGGHFGLNIPEIPKGFLNIPKLEKGAVLEGGNPFLAWINDQPRGQTNIETPLSTMIEAFKTALGSTGSQNIVIEASGDFNQFIRFLNLKLKQEDARVGQSFVSGDAWI